MKYAYLITNRMEKELSKNLLSPKILDEIDKDRNSTKPLDEKYSYCGHPKIKVHKWQTSGGPRFIYFEEVRGEITIYVLRKVYDDHDQYTLKFDHVDKNNWYLWNGYKEDESLEIDLMFEGLTEKVVKDILPDEFRKYEERPRRFEASTDMIIYELLEWVNGYADVDDLYKKSIYDALAAIVVKHNYDPDQFDQNGFYTTEVEGYQIVMRLDVSDNKGVINGVYLLQIAESVNMEELLEHKYNCKDITQLRRKAAKCYPDFLLLDFKSWKSIEDDSQANLALSDEELEILQHIDYPFFVSGLAGSGKSTILYYLYAHIYDYESKTHPDHPLLFLSYSKKLVANAQNIVKSILCHHPSYNLANIFEDKEKSRKFDRSFQPFQEFIKSEFLSVGDYDDYASGKYIDYRKFKQYYLSCKLPEARNYSSDIVWSVIRTFIKGKSNNIFTPMDYESADLPAKDRTVTKEDYRQIYKIWENWYKKYFDDKIGWDDLDLVRYALTKYDNSTHFHKYAVVFCDEAQDFTKIETDLILKLSVHSKYNLATREEDAKIPIAFAGDPNQTINPTGFRWGSTQEIFNESFKGCLASFTGFKPNELRTNYRSREGIVKFANTIQYIRHHLLSDGKQHFSLQEAWDSEQSGVKTDGDGLNYVAFYSLDTDKEKILNGLQKAIIITADEGEYGMDHVQNDPYLKDVDPSKLFTAITAKGLEFKATILYKFGSDPSISIFERLINGDQISDDSEKYQLSHFFTKLYIAISRAKQVLFIVDTDEACEKFWKYFMDRDLWEKFLRKHMPSNVNDLGCMSRGDIYDFEHRLAENYKPKEYAESLFKNALEEEDSETMNRARSAYKEAKYEDKAELCKAYIYKFNHEYVKAGEKFYSLNKNDLALESYWDGNKWDQVLSILQVETKPYEGRIFKKAVATFMDEKSSVQDFLKVWKDNEDEFQDSLSNPKDRELWNRIIDKICAKTSSLKPKDITASLVRDLDRFSDYVEWFEDGMALMRAELHFKRAEFDNRDLDQNDPDFNDADYKAAIKCWDAVKATPNSYYTANKAISKSPSEKIIWMEKLGESADIIAKYGSVENASNLNEIAQNIVFNCLLTKDMAKALEYPYPKDSSIKWNTLYIKDRINFLRMIILRDFTNEKFEFLQNKVDQDDFNVFQSKMPSDVFDSIFSLIGVDPNDVPYWTYFVSGLKNKSEERVLKNPINRDAVLDSLGKIIKSSPEINKPLATCFLEMLFDEEYNSGRAKKYCDVLTYIFKRDIFFKEDFRIVTKRNAYFTQYCQLEGDDVDRIKVNIHKFTHEYLASINKKITAAMVDDVVKPLFLAFEISVPYESSYPNYANICGEYRKFLNDRELKKTFELPSMWIERRLTFNKLLEDAQLGTSTFEQIQSFFKEHHDDLDHFVRMLSKEDTIAFIIATNRTDCDYSYDSIMIAAEAIYNKHLRRDDFRPYCTVNQLRDTLSGSVDQAIKELLSNKSHVKEYEMKLLSFVWEALGDHAFAATHYDDLIDRKRLDKVTRLKNYFKQRALLHYSYLKQKDFDEKQLEYNVAMTKDYLPAAYPNIEKEDETAPQPKSEKPVTPKEAKKSTAVQKAETAIPARQVSAPIAEPANAGNDPVKQAMIEMARKMKESGMEIEQIMTFTNLSKTEVRKA